MADDKSKAKKDDKPKGGAGAGDGKPKADAAPPPKAADSKPADKKPASKNKAKGGSKPPPKPKKRIKLSDVLRWTLVFGLTGGMLWLMANVLNVISFSESTFGGRTETSLLALSQPSAQVVAPTSDNSLVAKIRRGEPISFVIFGYGGEGHPGAYLSDTIIQVIIDPAKNSALLLSIPRDLYVFIPHSVNGGGNWGKINSAFSYVMNFNLPPASLNKRYTFQPSNISYKIDAGAILGRDTVEAVTGVPAEHWIALNFDGFKNLVDALGGVTVTVEKPFTDREYLMSQGNKLVPLQFQAGTQTLNGTLALAYARSRMSAQDGGDGARSKRQIQLISALRQKLSSGDVVLKIPTILDGLKGNFRTSLPLNEVLELVNYANSEEGRTFSSALKIQSEVLDGRFLTTGNNEAGFVFLPKAGRGKYEAIREWVTQLRAGTPG